MIRGRRRWSPTPPPRRPRAEFRKAASGRRTASNCPGASTNRRVSARGVNPGTWAQQGTTAFKVKIWVWGALDEPIPANDNDLIERMAA